MKPARDILQQLQITELIDERAGQVFEVRNRRRIADQDVAFGARPFIYADYRSAVYRKIRLPTVVRMADFVWRLVATQTGAFRSAKIDY